MAELSVRETAMRLGISEQRTRQMLREKELTGRQVNGHTWLVDATSVQDRARVEPGRGRPWSDQTLEAIVTALARGSRIDAKSATRLRATEAEQLARKIAQAFAVRRFRTRHQDLVRTHLALTGESAIEHIGGALVGQSAAMHGYVRGIRLDDLIDDAGLVESGDSNVTLYLPRTDLDGDVGWTGEANGYAPKALIAVDCVRSAQTRVRSAGIAALDDMRNRWLASNT